MQAIRFRDKKFLGLVCVGIGIAVLFSLLLPTQTWAGAIHQWLKSLGPWALPAFVGVYMGASICGLPNVVLLLMAGTIFGLPLGVLSASIADTAGAIACFVLGRTVLRQQVKGWIAKNAQFAKLDHAVAKKGWKILLLSRLSPLIPSNVLNYGFSCTKVKFRHYLFCTWLGMLPIVSFYVYIGHFGLNLLEQSKKPGGLLLQLAGVGVAIAAAVHTTRLAQKTLATDESAG